MSSGAGKGPISKNRIEKSILLLRGRKVMLDADLASLYEVETRVLVQAVKRNLDRFPDDFMFQLTKEEFDLLRSQIVISSTNCRHDTTKTAVLTSGFRSMCAPARHSSGRRTREIE